MEKLRYERPIIRRLDSEMPNKFGMRTDYRPTTQIEGVAVKTLIEEFGSPLFVISEKVLRSQNRKARKAFTTRYPKVQFAWSYKTNYISAVCNVFHQEGSWAEVVSGFEFQKALGNGVEGSKIIFNGPDKSEEDLEMAIKHNSLIHIDHLDELYTLTELADRHKTKPRVAIRVNMDTGVYPMWDRFGFNYENGQAWDALNKIMHSGKLELVGLHCHIGTFMLSTQAYAVAAGKLAELAIGVQRKFNHTIKYIDMGGGFTSKNTLKGAYLPGSDTNPSFDDYAEAITTALLNADFTAEYLPTLILETGRALVDEAGYVLGTVISNKRSSKGKRITIVDIGVNLMFTSFWYDHKVTPAQEFTQYAEDTTLNGPLCMNIDVIRESVSLPLLNKGDNIVVHSVGAYNMTQWMQFITLRPAVVMIDVDGKPHIIREKENLNTVNGQERIPIHLNRFEL
ncbi:MAG: diaminopimelate decarboxylase [Bacteroidetes bacterium HGW-Bacteroidetes-22]|nr:MAG: diaminopimelate decarboxylase [Bacteroidetes bacterium HGW-Bacteroidetes-22]